jgi:hypothetical protein
MSQKKVSKMLFSKERVELASINDLKNAIKVGSQASNQLDFQLNEIKKYSSELRRIKKLLDVQFEPVIKIIDKRIQDLESIELAISKQIKELGINESNVKELSDAQNLRNELTKKMRDLEQGIKVIRNFAKSI